MKGKIPFILLSFTLISQALLSPRELRQKVSRVKQPLAEHRLTVQLSGKNNNKYNNNYNDNDNDINSMIIVQGDH